MFEAMDKIFVPDKKYFVMDKINLSWTNIILSWTKNILSRQMDRAFMNIQFYFWNVFNDFMINVKFDHLSALLSMPSRIVRCSDCYSELRRADFFTFLLLLG